MPSRATHKDVKARGQTERGGRRPNPMRQTAERARNAVARLCGKERRSIHHKFASKPVNRSSPRTFRSANPPRNKAKPRGTKFQAPSSPPPSKALRRAGNLQRNAKFPVPIGPLRGGGFGPWGMWLEVSL